MQVLILIFASLIVLTRTGLLFGEACPAHRFDCGNGKCVDEMFHCDGDNDCGNLKDEDDCENFKAELKCYSSQFKCVTGDHCIPHRWHCDGEEDCRDGSDEKECECIGFTCSNHQCIPLKWRCDGNKDCADGSDEELCPGKLCSELEFLCSSGSCLNRSLVCDGNKDCGDGSDEGSNCTNHCENATCSQNCSSTPLGPQCFCNDGYTLDPKDSKACLDVDECSVEGFCSHHCTNSLGGYVCTCQSGYDLVNRTCKARGGDPLLVFSTTSEIRAMRLRSQEYFLVKRSISKAITLDVDPKTQQVYWVELSEKSAVFSGKIDGSSSRMLFSHGLQVPEDIAVDYVANNIYLTDSGLQQVMVCKMDGTICHVLHKTNVEKPRSIVLDLSEGLLYWSDWGDHTAGIYRSGMDGTRRINLVSTRIGWPNSIALDHTTNRLYWADAKLKTIEYITLDGISRKVIMNATTFHPYSLTVFEDTIYWSDWSTFSLESCNKFTGHRVRVLAKENGRHIMGVHVYHPVLIARVSNPCWSNDCSHMCLISPVSGFRCACPHGFELGKDGKTCAMSDISEALFVSEGSSIFYIRPGAVGSETIDDISLPLSTVMISKVAFNKNLRYLFVADVSSPAIHGVNMTSQHMRTLVKSDIYSPEDLSFDLRSNNLYWIDSTKGTVEVISVDSLQRSAIVENLRRPIALAISQTTGLMFVAAMSPIPSVTMYDMDGKNIKKINSVQGVPLSIALHPTKSILYWADPTAGTISYVNYTTSRSSRVLISRIDGVISVAASENYIYWTNRKRELNLFKKNVTHILQLPGEEKGVVTRKVTYSSGISSGSSECMIGNGGCTHLCLTSSKGRTCACPSELVLAVDNVTCAARKCEASDFKCVDGQCVPSELKCDGKRNCLDGSDETGCNRCPGDDFQCKNGRCIVKSWQCDGRNDCADNSDEENCASTTCLDDHIACSNGECVSILWRCDGEPDCEDGTDELNCNRTSCDPGSHFRCENGQCIALSWVCDKTRDCQDNSDEKNCSFNVCTVHEFKCESDGACIDEMLQCDGRPNCKDGSDERNCPSSRTDCKIGMFRCKDGACIYENELCDGHNDCSNNEDELNCTQTLCQPEEYHCPSSKKCIIRRWICDGDADCPDESDEENCGEQKTQPKSSPAPIDSECKEFYCYATHTCLPLSKVCDGRQDCDDLNDEGGLCARSCSGDNGGCSHSCRKTPYGALCSCDRGYRLLEDNKTCDDVDECTILGTCSHFCNNTKGGFKCSCAEGYYLHNNHRHCKADGAPAILMYLLGDQIRGLNLADMTQKVYLNVRIADMKGMDYDASKSVFFWTELRDGSINSYSLETKQHKVVLRSLSKPIIVRYDWIAQNLYFKDKSSSIAVCTVDGKYSRTIVPSSMTRIDSMDISPIKGFIFWTVWANLIRGQHSGLIERAEMDGSHRIVIVSHKTNAPTAVTVDHVLSMIYWSDKQLNILECADFSGFNRRQVVRANMYHPLALAVFEDDVYWADWGSDSIIRCNKFTEGENCTRVIEEDVKTHVLMIVQKVMQPRSENRCLSKNCTHLGLLTRSSCRCACDDVNDGTCTSEMDIVSTSSSSTPVSLRSQSYSTPPFSNASASSKLPLSPECPENYCESGAECIVRDGQYECLCSSPYSGQRCEVKAAATQSNYNYNWVIAFTFAILLAVVIALGILMCIRNREKIQRMRENVSVKFLSPKNSRDGHLVTDTDDGICEELVIEEKRERTQSHNNCDYTLADSEDCDCDLKRWPSDGRDSSLLNNHVTNFFRKLKLNASQL